MQLNESKLFQNFWLASSYFCISMTLQPWERLHIST